MRSINFLLMTSVVLGTAGWLALGCSDDPAPPATPTDTTPDAGPDVAPQGQCPEVAAPEGDCTNAKCTAANGEPSICLDGACVKLKSAECPVVVGDVSDDATIIIGSISQIDPQGDSAAEGIAVRNSIDLAFREINARGIPFQDVCAKPRRLALVGCEESTDAVIKAGATHLVNTLKVPAIIGANFSGDTLAAASVTMPSKTLLISPSATAAAITTLEGATQDGVRVLWRTSPSDVIQSDAMRSVYAELEGLVKAGGVADDVRVAVISKGDAYGLGVEKALKESLVVNGKPHAENADGVVLFQCYHEESDECPADKDSAAALAALVAQKPHVIILTGTAEAVAPILEAYESALQVGDPKPFWLLPDGMRTTPLVDYAKGKADFISRVRGTVPGVVTPLAQTFFNLRYTAAFPNNPTLSFGMAGAYDAAYMLAYAIAANGTNPLTGINLAKSLSKLVGGTERIDVGPARMNAAFTALLGGSSIDINGASGPLDFDPTTGEAASDIAVWCLRVDPNNGNVVYGDATGQSYNATEKKLVGTFTCQD